MNNSWKYLENEIPNIRDWQRTDTFYVTPDGSAFWTPDGEGRYWYDSLEEARADCGYDLTRVHYFDA